MDYPDIEELSPCFHGSIFQLPMRFRLSVMDMLPRVNDYWTLFHYLYRESEHAKAIDSWEDVKYDEHLLYHNMVEAAQP